MLPSIFGENLFDDFFSDPFEMMMPQSRNPLYGKHAKNLMKTDVRETENSFEVDMDLPGFKKDEVNLELKDGYLTVSADKALDKDKKDNEGCYIRQERWSGSCSRSFYVGENVKPEDVHAKFEDGILRLSLPKQEQKQLPSSAGKRVNMEYLPLPQPLFRGGQGFYTPCHQNAFQPSAERIFSLFLCLLPLNCIAFPYP